MSNNAYKTACGYIGTESGNPSNGGSCGQTSVTDSVTNVANPTYFAAFRDNDPSRPMNCGLCAQITFGGRTIVATIVDDCASCDDSDHLDLSMSAANALGLTQASGNPHSGVTWKSVSCPVNGDIVASYNLDNNSQPVASQVYFQNVVFPVASATSGGRTANFMYGFWDFGGMSMPGQSVTLTDIAGHTVTGTIPGSSNGGSIGVQFADTCQ
jgi:expansin (peptidoglycan-binding protein)